MKGYYVEVRVGPLMKQYIEHSLQMDVVRPGQGSVLVDLMRPHLELRRYDQLDLFGQPVVQEYPEEETIRIEIPVHNIKSYNHHTKKNIAYNYIYRTELSEVGQAILRRHFKKIMRLAFHTYMDGATSSWDSLDKKRVKCSVASFLMDYYIKYDEKDVSTLCRDWFRYRKKKYDQRISPVIN